MSISGIGSADSMIYQNVNRSNNRKNGTALFNQARMTDASVTHGVSD